MKSIRLKAGKERALLRRHPWVFDHAIAKGSADAGETVRVTAADGRFLAWAAFSPESKIRARAWSFTESDRIDAPFLIAAVQASVRARAGFDIQSDGVRLVHGESDGLPGLVVDRYGDTLVAQFLACGVERFKTILVQALLDATGLTKLYERSDTQSRALEGLPAATGWLHGQGPTALVVQEHDHLHRWQLGLDIAQGHKTGFYLDQRDNRLNLARSVRRLGAQRVLNCYAYTGGFSVAARLGGAAQVLSVDSSGPALAQARHNLAMNGLSVNDDDFLDADVNATLRQMGEQGRVFDAIVLDPPKFAPSAAHAERAARAYKDINRLALKLLAPGGVLYTFSCSGGISADLFHKIVASAGTDAGVNAYITQRLGGAPDHPMTVNFPEGEYLKGLVLQRAGV